MPNLSSELCLLILEELAVLPLAERRKQYKVLCRVSQPFAELATVAFGKEIELERKRAVNALLKAPQLIGHLTTLVISFSLLYSTPYYLTVAHETVLDIISSAPLLNSLELGTGIFEPERLLSILQRKLHLNRIVLDCREIKILHGDKVCGCCFRELIVVHEVTWGAGRLLKFLAPLHALRSLKVISLQPDPTFPYPIHYGPRLNSLALADSDPGSCAEILSFVGREDSASEQTTLAHLSLSLKSSIPLDAPRLDHSDLAHLLTRLGPNLKSLSLSLPTGYFAPTSLLAPLSSLRSITLSGSPITSLDFLNSLPTALESVTFLGFSSMFAFFLNKCLFYDDSPRLRFIRTGDGDDHSYDWTKEQLRGLRGLKEQLREKKGIEWAHLKEGKFMTDF